MEEECRTTFDWYTSRRSEPGPEGGVAPTRSQAVREQDRLSRLEDQLRELEDQLWVLEDQLRVLENGDKRSPLLPAPTSRSPPKLLLSASTDGGLPRALLPAVPDRCSLPYKTFLTPGLIFTTLGSIGGLPDWSASLH